MSIKPNELIGESILPKKTSHLLSGMTKREWMAATILCGLASGIQNKDRFNCDKKSPTWEAVMLADELIKELNKEK